MAKLANINRLAHRTTISKLVFIRVILLVTLPVGVSNNYSSSVRQCNSILLNETFYSVGEFLNSSINTLKYFPEKEYNVCDLST